MGSPMDMAQDTRQCLCLSHRNPRILKLLPVLPLVRGNSDGAQGTEKQLTGTQWGVCSPGQCYGSHKHF